MTNSITPTVGRHVNFVGPDKIIRAAIVVKVHGPQSVNLCVFGFDGHDDVMGYHHDVTHADIAIEPHTENSWHWMPFQIGQAKAAT